MADTSSHRTFDELATTLNAIRDLLQAQTRTSSELLTRDGIAALLNVGVSTFDRMKAAGKIGPASLQCGGLKWVRREVLSWLENRDRNGELLNSADWSVMWATLQARGKGR